MNTKTNTVYKIKQTSHRIRWRATRVRQTLVLGLVVLCASSISLAQGNYYRYINSQGVRVMSSSIPPEYAQKGYEVIGPTGQVIRVVEPAPAPEDMARVEKERAMLAEYRVLARRYSSTDDIWAARDRRLAHLDANIAILRGNINNLSSQIEGLMSEAANIERRGRNIPQRILDNIDELRTEVSSAEDLLQQREQEYEGINKRFADDVDLFERGRALEQEKATLEANKQRR